MAFEPGDHVHVADFGKGVVREARNGGRYLVELKGRAMLVAASQLTSVEARKPRQKTDPAPATDGVSNVSSGTPASRAIDLHGKTADDAVAALDEFLNDAMLEGAAEVRIIHGRSGGRLKAAVHARLKQLASVRSYLVDPANPGVTIAKL